MTKAKPKTGNLDSVFTALDAQAVSLLAKLDGIDRDADDQLLPAVAISDQVKAFNAVVAYAALRAKVEPPEELPESGFGALRTKYHGTGDGGAPARRARRAAPAAPGTIHGNGGGFAGNDFD